MTAATAQAQVRVKLTGSDEVFDAPQGFGEADAVRWIAHLYHPTADRVIKQTGPNTYRCGNGRRGPDKRETIVTVVR